MKRCAQTSVAKEDESEILNDEEQEKNPKSRESVTDGAVVSEICFRTLAEVLPGLQVRSVERYGEDATGP